LGELALHNRERCLAAVSNAFLPVRTLRHSRTFGPCVAVWALLAINAACLPAADRFSVDRICQQLGYERIELKRSGENRLYLFGKLDGRKQSVLVDTGWSVTTLSPGAAEACRSPEIPRPEFFPATNSVTHAVMGSLHLGRVVFTNQPALVQEMTFNGQRAPFDVVLGCDFLLRHFAVMDCANRRLYTRRSAASEREQTELENQLSRAGFASVNLKRTQPLALSCPASLNGEAVELLVDTGAVWSCLDAELANRLGLKLLPTPRQLTGAGATGRRGFAVTQARSVELGRAKMGPLNFAALQLGDWGLASPGAALAEVGGILGGPELAAWQAILDCQGLKLWFKPPSARR
jgi:predicted aspartyl protease